MSGETAGAVPMVWPWLLTWLVGLGAIGAAATELGPWYYGLRKPEWKPSDALFGPVWTTIFVCAATAAYLAWRSDEATPALRSRILLAYGINAVLNVGWSVLFFRLKRPDWALVEVIPLWLSIVAMAWAVVPAVPWAGWLFTPYLAWVAFAAVLNRWIVVHNGPFAVVAG